MSCARFCTAGVILLVILFQYIQSAEVLLERAEVYYFNKKYLSNATAFVRRTGRRSPYYVHMEGTTLIWAGDNVTSTEVIPERAEVTYFNKMYLSNMTIYIRRTSRRSPYYINWEWANMEWLGNNVSVHVVFYEFLHNEYRRSFVEFEIDLCDVKYKEPWRTFVGLTLIKRGFLCPIPPGVHTLNNVTVSMINFPYVWPFEKTMAEGNFKLKTTQEIVFSARIYGTFKRGIPK